MRREDLFSGVANPPKPFHPVAQLPQLAQGGLGPATPVKQRVDMFHDLAQFTQMRQATGDPQEPVTFGWRQSALDEQEATLEYVTDFLLNDSVG